MYGYIYKFTFTPTAQWYIGKHKYEKDSVILDEKYWGSGKKWRELIKTVKKVDWNTQIKREILDTAESKDELNEKEILWISKLDATHCGLNVAIGGENPVLFGEDNGFYGHTHSDEIKKHISEKSKLWQQSIDNKALHSELTKNGMKNWLANLSDSELSEKQQQWSAQNSGENNPMFGKKHSEEAKEKISKKRTEYLTSRQDDWIDPAQTVEAREKRKNSLKGHCVSEETRKKLREFNISHCWVHNDFEQKQILKIEINAYLDSGFSVGKLKKNKLINKGE